MSDNGSNHEIPQEIESLRWCATSNDDNDPRVTFDPTMASIVVDYLDDVLRELTDANSELARHHRDFEMICLALEIEPEGFPLSSRERLIRNIVG